MTEEVINFGTPIFTAYSTPFVQFIDKTATQTSMTSIPSKKRKSKHELQIVLKRLNTHIEKQDDS